MRAPPLAPPLLLARSRQLARPPYFSRRPVEGKQLDALVDKFKSLADEKKAITDADIEAIVYSGMVQPESFWTLLQAHVFTGTDAKPTATVTLRHKTDGERSASAMGSGPIDAVYNAIKEVVKRPNDLTHFSVQSVTDGQTALGEVTIKVAPTEAGGGKRDVKGLRRISSHSVPAAPGAPVSAATQQPAAVAKFLEEGEGTGAPTFSGTAINRDIIVAAAHAYVAALNRLMAADLSGHQVSGAGDIGASV